MKHPNYEETQGKHPIPHAKDIAKDDNLGHENKVDNESKSQKSEEEE